MLYNNFDKIVCINLKERTDKYNSIKKVSEKLNIPIEFYFAEKHSESGRIGCFESHLHVIKECYNNGGKNILIFEDDFIETSSYNETKIKDILDFLRKNEWCEYFQLGYTILPHELYKYFSSKTLTENIIQYNGNGAHSYILNRAGMKRIINTWENNIQTEDLDIYYKKIFLKNGASICPILFDQNFCINNDNDPATTIYYRIMRYLSCLQYNLSFLYLLSIIRSNPYYTFIPFFLFFLSIILFSILWFYEKKFEKPFKKEYMKRKR